MHHETVDLGAVVIRFFRASGAWTFDASDFDDSAWPSVIVTGSRLLRQLVRRLAQ